MGIYRLPNGLVRAGSPAASRTQQAGNLPAESPKLRDFQGTIAPLTCRAAAADVTAGFIAFVFLVFFITPVSLFGAAKNSSVPQLNGYKAVRVRYGPMNQM